LRHCVQLGLSILSAITLSLALIKITDTQFTSSEFYKRSLLIIHFAPFWYKIAYWANQIWIWSEFIVMFTNKEKRALHDFIAGTVVIKKEFENAPEHHRQSLNF